MRIPCLLQHAGMHSTTGSEHQEDDQRHDKIDNENRFHISSQSGLSCRARNTMQGIPKGQTQLRSTGTERGLPRKHTDIYLAMSLMRNVDVRPGPVARYPGQSRARRLPADGGQHFPQPASNSVLKFSGRDAWNASIFSSSAAIRCTFGVLSSEILHRSTLNICANRHTSAIVTLSPWQ